MTYDDQHRMNEHHPVLATSNLGLIVLNFILGFAGNDIVNALVAFTGLFITLLANVQRIFIGGAWFIAFARSGWKLTENNPPIEPSTTAPQEDEKEQQ